jgi:LysM domain
LIQINAPGHIPFNLEIFATAFLRLRASPRTLSIYHATLRLTQSRRVSYQLAAINYPKIDSTCSNLEPGSTLCLGYAGEDCTATYVVVAGDICDEIVARHNINTTILYENNPQINKDCTNIYDGEVRIQCLQSLY